MTGRYPEEVAFQCVVRRKQCVQSSMYGRNGRSNMYVKNLDRV